MSGDEQRDEIRALAELPAIDAAEVEKVVSGLHDVAALVAMVPDLVEMIRTGEQTRIAALKKYGHHLGTCQAFQGGACDCGFDEAKGN